MISSITAAYVFCIFTAVGVIFQFALALGTPWGELAMGGKFPGSFSPLMRASALAQMMLLVLMALVVLIRSGLILNELFELSKSAIWFVVALCVVSAFLNTITPSKKERMLWSPVTIVLVICAFIVARS